MRMPRKLKDEKGIALLSVFMFAILIVSASAAAYAKALFEHRVVVRELARVRSFAAAEAGLQSGMAQISQNAYTGFINTTAINVANFQSASGVGVGSYQVTLNYPNQADWVIIQSTGTADGDTRRVEGRIFLDSNLSKYLVYADTTTFSSGDNAQYGVPDYTDANNDGVADYPQLVAENENDRASLYFTNNWDATGSNVELFGDVNAEGSITGNSTTDVNGDTYAGNCTPGNGGNGQCGISGNIKVGDGFSDDADRNGDGIYDAKDYLDQHALTAAGDDDAHAKETLVQIDHNFYANNNNISAFSSTIKNRYIVLQTLNNGTQTRVVEYSSANYTSQVASYTLPANAIVYVRGDMYVKGDIGGRVSFVASDDIFFTGNVKYYNNKNYVDPNHSTAFLAKDKLYFQTSNQSVSGILYAENSSNDSVAFDASTGAAKNTLNLYGNRILNGGSNLSTYPNRVYAYDKGLRYYRPPGIPVVASLRVVREVS